MRGWDFRNKTDHGLTLILASPFENEGDYIQAKGRVCRGADEGQIYELQEDMYEK